MNKKYGNLAPVIIFTYRRNIDNLIESLLKNNIAKYTNLIIYSDGYKSEVDRNDVVRLRKYLKEINGFKSIEIYESNKNKGLANSVINGVTEIINRYGKVIVLEDDLIISSDYLNFMNDALNFYQNNHKIWSISGYTPLLKIPNNYNKDLFLSYRANSWGWASWKNRWDKIDWEVKDWNTFKKNKKEIIRFNKGGNDLFKMLESQMLGKIDSWAIRWCYNQFRYDCYTVYPMLSKSINQGFDEKGTHNSTGIKRWTTIISSKKIEFCDLEVNDEIIKLFKKKYDLRIKTRIGYFLKKYGAYSIAKKFK